MHILAAGTSFTSTLDKLGPILLLVGVAAAVLAYFKTQVTSKTIENLKEYAESLQKDRDELKSRVTALEAKLHDVITERNTLKTYVTGTEAVKVLASAIKNDHSELIGHVMAIEAMLTSAINTDPVTKPRVRVTKTATPKRSAR